MHRHTFGSQVVIRAVPRCVVLWSLDAWQKCASLATWRRVWPSDLFWPMSRSSPFLVKKKNQCQTLGWVFMNFCLCSHGRLGPNGACIKLGLRMITRIKASLPTHSARRLSEKRTVGAVCYWSQTQPTLTHTTALPVQRAWLPRGVLGCGLLCYRLGIYPKEIL